MAKFKNVALVGRPNVGKSRLFNRLVGKRVSIVHDQPGVTRDIVFELVDNHFQLMDTGGLGMPEMLHKSPKYSLNLATDPDGSIQEATEIQVFFAIDAADLILFVVDADAGLTAFDLELAQRLRKHGKITLLVVNKIDSKKGQKGMDAFYELGFKDTLPISAEKGTGIPELLEAIKTYIPKPTEEELEAPHRLPIPKCCFLGKPNVGKSSLINALFNEPRLIVSEVAGTTRDSVTLRIEHTNKQHKTSFFDLIDTAGLRRKGRVQNTIEYFSMFRTEESIKKADIVFLVIDALEGVTKQEKLLAGKVLEEGKGLIVIVNKWDHTQDQFRAGGIPGYADVAEFRAAFKEDLRRTLFFLPESSIIFTSAATGYGIERLLSRARGLYEALWRDLSTSKINQILQKLLERDRPKMIRGKRFKAFYATQTGHFPFKIRIFCNDDTRVDNTYKRYLKNGFQEALKLEGCPIELHFIGKMQQAARGRKSPNRLPETAE